MHPDASYHDILKLLNGSFGSKFTDIEAVIFQKNDNSTKVLKAYHKVYQVVAVKMVSITGTQAGRRCKREDNLLETFSSDVHQHHICRRFASRLLEFPAWNPVQVLVLEHMKCGTVADLLEQAPGRLDQITVARIAIDVLSGLQAFHNHGIAHRDIKDSNIGVTYANKGDKPTYKILDLGISVADAAGAGAFIFVSVT